MINVYIIKQYKLHHLDIKSGAVCVFILIDNSSEIDRFVNVKPPHDHMFMLFLTRSVMLSRM
jgi:hypothetical protein